MTKLLAHRPFLSRFFDDDANGFPGSFFSDDRLIPPSRMFNAPMFRGADEEVTIPAVNIKENAKNFEIELAAPGYKKEDLKVTVEDGMLAISSEKEQKAEKEEGGYSRKEFSYTSFNRAFMLPENVDPDSVKARFEDGVLKLTVDKTKELPERNKKEVKIA
ncbi:MAG: Hsp20/alpha crystallin family protein [Flavobacteriales bacterium]|nr:Hsp20/alpha crystallin family protein [Flavobacteriales bacterium]